MGRDMGRMGEWDEGVPPGWGIACKVSGGCCVFAVEIATEIYYVIRIYESDQTRVYTAAWRVPGVAVLSEGGGGVQGDVQIL